jgi:hypothetical protein
MKQYFFTNFFIFVCLLAARHFQHSQVLFVNSELAIIFRKTIYVLKKQQKFIIDECFMS